jgi:hypothetical protein
MPNVETLLRDHITLNVDCIDRLYLNGYVPLLQRPQNLWWFFTQHRQQPILSPVLLKRLSDSFVARIHGFAKRHNVPIVHFHKGQRKDDVARERLARHPTDEGVVLIGVAQEKVVGFRLKQKKKRNRQERRSGRPPIYAAFRGSVHVNQYYFYLVDRDFGLSFIKFSSYVPFGVKVWLNGHEWAKRQLDKQAIRYASLENGFLACDEPSTLQKVCSSLSPDHINRFFRKWLRKLPHPFSREDRRAGFTYNLSILQMEMSLTQVFDRPLRGREFFEEVIRENLDIGRPERVQLLFERRVTRRTPGSFRTRIITQGVCPSLRFQYKHTRIKQYFKCDRALRTETTFNDTYDFKIGRSLGNLPRLCNLGRHTNHRLLTLERVAHHCAIASRSVERVVLPTTTDEDERAPALRWGDPRAMALLSALCAFIATPEGFTNRQLRTRVGALHDPGPRGYTAGRMSYDLRRLRLKGIIQRVPHSHRYVLTPAGRRIALFMTKSYVRVVRPILHRLDPDLPEDTDDALRRTWQQCERQIAATISRARLAA